MFMRKRHDAELREAHLSARLAALQSAASTPRPFPIKPAPFIAVKDHTLGPDKATGAYLLANKRRLSATPNTILGNTAHA